MHQNMQAVKLRFKPLHISLYDIGIIIERDKRFRGIVGDFKGVYTPRRYPTTNKKPSKTPCNVVVYIRMYTTIASRLKGYTSHYKEARGKHSETLRKSHILKLAAVTPCRYQKEDQTSGNRIDDKIRLSKSFGGSHLESFKIRIYYPSVPSVKKPVPSVFRIFQYTIAIYIY